MKALLIGIFAGVVLCGACVAQDTTQPTTNGTMPRSQQSPATLQSPQSKSGQLSEAPRIAPGSVIPVQLTKSIDVKKVKTGDEVTITAFHARDDAQNMGMLKELKTADGTTYGLFGAQEQREAQQR